MGLIDLLVLIPIFPGTRKPCSYQGPRVFVELLCKLNSTETVSFPHHKNNDCFKKMKDEEENSMELTCKDRIFPAYGNSFTILDNFFFLRNIIRNSLTDNSWCDHRHIFLFFYKKERKLSHTHTSDQ